MTIIFRILYSPFILCILAVSYTIQLTIAFYRYFRYGGETIVYAKDDKEMISGIYQHLKQNQR